MADKLETVRAAMSERESPIQDRPGGQLAKYPKGAINDAIDALELAYSYLRDAPVIASRIDGAIRYLRHANELYDSGEGE